MYVTASTEKKTPEKIQTNSDHSIWNDDNKVSKTRSLPNTLHVCFCCGIMTVIIKSIWFIIFFVEDKFFTVLILHVYWYLLSNKLLSVKSSIIVYIWNCGYTFTFTSPVHFLRKRIVIHSSVETNRTEIFTIKF